MHDLIQEAIDSKWLRWFYCSKICILRNLKGFQCINVPIAMLRSQEAGVSKY